MKIPLAFGIDKEENLKQSNKRAYFSIDISYETEINEEPKE